MPDNLQNTGVFLILRAQCLDSVFSPLSYNLKHLIILRPMKRITKILKATLSIALGLILIAEMYCINEVCVDGKAYAELRDKLRIWDIDRSRRRAQNKATSYPRNISDHFIVDTITIPNPVIFKLGDYDYVVSDSIFRACYNPADSSFSREEYLLRYLQYHLDGYNFPPHSFLSTSDYFLKAEISEKYYALLSSVKSANFRTPYEETVYKLSGLNGRIISYGKSANDNSYYVPVIFEFDNKGAIIPGTFVEIWLLGKEKDNILTVPTSALIEEQGLYFVYRQTNEDGYMKTEVKLGSGNGEEFEVLSGLKAGDVVVTKGAYQIKLASASNIIPAHTHNH